MGLVGNREPDLMGGLGRELVKSECGQQAKHAVWAADGDLGELMLFGARVVGKRIQAARDLNKPAAFDQAGKGGAGDPVPRKVACPQRTAFAGEAQDSLCVSGFAHAS
jgi:hypothetical protein